MSKQPETIFKERVQRDLENIILSGGHVWWTKIQQVSVRGTPDMLLCVNGTFWAIELKKDAKSRPSKLQSYVLGLIKRAGGHATVESPETWPNTLAAIKILSFEARDGS
jgi:hypothetical protein